MIEHPRLKVEIRDMFGHRPNVPLRLALPVLALLLWTGCRTVPRLPEAEVSDLFNTFESGFSISAREGIIRYVVTLEEKTGRADPIYSTVHFENPAAANRPFVEQVDISPDEAFVFLESPPLSELEADSVYRIWIDFYKDPTRTELIDEHEVFILSTIETKRYGR